MTTDPRAHVIGYARVSTARQNLDRQIDALEHAGASKIFSDKLTGRTMDRPQWKACREYLRSGDELVIDNLDRLGRSMREVVDTVQELTEAGVVIRSLKQGLLDSTTATGRLMVQIFAMLAEFEVDLKAERAAAAREAAAARGQHTGRPRKLTSSDAVRAHELKAQGLSAAEVGKALGISRASVYRYLSTTEGAVTV